MKIKLEHKQTKKIKYITKRDGYPVDIGDTIAFARSTTVDDVWVVKAIKMEATITPQQRRQLKKGLAERTKVRRRKEDERRQYIYK